MRWVRLGFAAVTLLFGATVWAAPPRITFNKHIAPILHEHCAPCHRPGEAGGFSLLAWTDAHKRAKLIEQVTRTRYMPPWLPEHGYGDFTGENRLKEAQIEQIRQWVSEGAPQGSPADAQPTPVFTPGWQVGKPDLILTVSKPFRVPAEGPDLFWNFILTPSIPQTRFVKSIEVRPGNARTLHHANLLIDRARSSRHLEQHSGEGFGGMDLNIETTTFDPDSHFLFWKPGGRPWVEPPGMGWKLERGGDLILNVHLHPTGKEELIQPSVGLFFTDMPPTDTPQLLQIERDNMLDIPPGTRDFLVSDDFRLPVDATAVAVYPHAHYLGKLLEGYATLPDGSRRWLVRIPQWNPSWQAVYHFRTPVFLPKGTQISMRFHYDNSAENPRNPNVPPKRVSVGNQSTDEMGHLWLQILTKGGQTDRELVQESLMRHRLENDPGNSNAHFNLGSLLLSRKEYPEAIAHLRESLRANPEQPIALNDLGVALEAAGKPADALDLFRKALRVAPAYQNARFNLANGLVAQGKLEEAAAAYRQILSAEPSDTNARDNLVAVLIRMGSAAVSAGQVNAATADYRELVALRPSDADMRNNFGILLSRVGDLIGAASQFEAALTINPAHGAARRNLEAVRKKSTPQ